MRTQYNAALSFAFTLALAATALGAGPVDVITNGGFEDGLTGWSPDPAQQLVRGAETASRGEACLSGEVTAPSRALKLRQSVRVKADCRYEFQISARGTKGVKLVLFVSGPDSSTRRSVAAWPDLTPKWQRYKTALDVKADGTMELEIIAPSSFNAEPGRIWIDDVALLETKKPDLTSVSESMGFNDEAAMAQADDGTLYVAWNSFRDGADSLQVAHYRPAGKTVEKLGAWQVLGGPGTYLLGIRAVAAGPKVYVLYAAEVDRNWDVYAVPCGAAGPGRPIRISRGAEVDVKPAGASSQRSDGRLWIAWESNPGGWRQVRAACLDTTSGQVGQAAQLTEPGASNYDPAVAVVGGRVSVAWHSFRENNFDIYFRQRPDEEDQKGGGDWQAERRLTRAATIDRHAKLLPKGPRGDELWLIYENATMGAPQIDNGPRTSTYAIGSTRTRRLIVAKVTPEGLLAPKDYATTSPVFKNKAEAPAAAFDESGRLWLACRTPGPKLGSGRRAKPRDWRVSITSFDGQEWSPPEEVSAAKGMDRYPAMVLTGSRAIIAHQADDTPTRWSNEQEATTTGQSDIYLSSVELGAAAQAKAIAVEPLVEPDDPFPPGEVRGERGEDQPTPSIVYQGRKLNLYFGDLHDHTEISICNRTGDESVPESYANMRDIVRHDFACVTDHGYNENPYLWYYTAKLARVNDDPNRFLTFLGEEWTSSIEEYDAKHPYGFYGHRNLVFADPYFPRWWNAFNRQTPAEVWEALGKLNANFVHIPHQLADTGNVPTDWDFTDETAQPVAEIFQGRGSYEYKGTPREARSTTPQGYFLQDAWARGIVIGVIASPDHTGGYGKACVYAPSLAREAILDAIRRRHCYGTTAAKILLDVRVDGHLMGEKVALPAASAKTVDVEIRAHCPADIDRVEVCRNNQFIYLKSPEGRQCEFNFADRQPLAGRSYYYVRVIQKDGEIAWSSPVWFGVE